MSRMDDHRAVPLSGWDEEDKHLIGMPQLIREDPRTAKSGYLRRLCSRCAAIPWAQLYSDERYAADGELRPAIEELKRYLDESPCRVCYLIGIIKTHGWLRYLQYVPAAPGSAFKGRLCVVPGEDTNVPAVWHSGLAGYLGILDNLEMNLPFPRPTSPLIDLEQVKGWITDCASSHNNPCIPDDSNKLKDFMAIDCETMLVCSVPKACKYVALSYVWGPPTEFAQEAYTFPVLPAQLPRTIADAILVTKKLGFRYIWIDRYCINQNDADHKMQQIRQMGAIYSSAQLTIVAAAGESPKHGLPGVSRARNVPMPYGEVIGSIALVFTSVGAANAVYESPWSYRAWTFQEGYLSRRRLFFTDEVLLYVCGRSMAGDVDEKNYQLGDIHEHRKLQLFLPWDAPMPAMDTWNTQSNNLAVAGRHMKAFSERRLTYDSDALNAILGILDQLAHDEMGPVYHIWGVPLAPFSRDPKFTALRRVSFEVALNWYHDIPCRRRVGFPTWSSVAWDGPVVYSYQDQLMVPDDVDVRVLCPEGRMTIEKYIDNGRVLSDSGSPQAPALLQLVQVTTIPLRLNKSDNNDVLACFELTSGLDVLLYVYFDDASQVLDLPFIGAIIYRDIPSERMLFLILAPKADFFERVGYTTFDGSNLGGVTLSDGRVLDRESGKPVTDAEQLKMTRQQPITFVSEVQQDIMLGRLFI